MHTLRLPLSHLVSGSTKPGTATPAKPRSVPRCCRRASIVGTVAFLLLAGHTCMAQHFVYNQKNDITAQDALAAGKEISSAGQFDKMLHNLDNQALQESNAVLAFTKEEMRASLASIDVWRNEVINPKDIPGLLLCKKSVRCTLEQISILSTLP
jgi:hypothetical protein